MLKLTLKQLVPKKKKKSKTDPGIGKHMNETEQRVNRPKCRFLVLIRKRDHVTNDVGLTG